MNERRTTAIGVVCDVRSSMVLELVLNGGIAL